MTASDPLRTSLRVYQTSEGDWLERPNQRFNVFATRQDAYQAAMARLDEEGA
jgi:hypothetical protein